MASPLQGKKIAFMATTGVEQVEYTEPRKAVEQAGAQADRKPADLPAFCAKIVEEFAESAHQAQAARTGARS